MRQLQGQIAQIQMQRHQISLRDIVLRGHRLHDVLAALGRRQQRQKSRPRPSVAPDLGHEVDTNLSNLGGPP